MNYTGGLVEVQFSGGETAGGQTAVATATISGGAFSSLTLLSGGSGYTIAPSVNLATGDEPSRDINNSGTQDFASYYPSQITVLNDGTVIVVAGIRAGNAGEDLSPNGLSYTSGIWVSTDHGQTWTDESYITGDTIYNNGNDMYNTSGDLLSTEAFSVTVDPNDPMQNTWFATTYYFGTQNFGTIYKTTDRGQHWSILTQWASGTLETGVVGQAENLWIQPGGTVMLVTTKLGLFYTPNYTAATPIFYPVQNFPYNGAASFQIVSDPFDSNKIYVTTAGGGLWVTDISQFTSGGVVQNLTAQTMSGTEVQLNWNVTAPTGTSYIIQTSTDDISWTPVAATAPNWQETSYLVTGLSTNTPYYFRVLSVGAGGDSLPSALASAITDGSGLAASESFAYAGTLPMALNGQGTAGSGWAGAWSDSSSNDTLVSGTINNSNPPLNTADYASITSTGSDASRTLSSYVGTPGSVLWLSFEIDPATGSNVLLGNTTNGIGIGTQMYSNYASLTVFVAGASTYYQSQPISGNTFIVARLEFDAGPGATTSVSVNFYINPKPGAEYPGTPTPWFYGTFNGTFTSPFSSTGTNLITLEHPTSGTAKYDEIRLGGTYAAVAPPQTAVTAPAAPSGITGTVSTLAQQTEIDLSWTNNATNQEGFTIQEYNGSAWTTIERLLNNSASGTLIKYDVTNLAANSTYQFRVSAFNTAGSSATNATGNITTVINPPPPVTNLAVTVSSGQFNLTWSSTGATTYTLEYADGSVGRSPYNDGELNWMQVTGLTSGSYNFTTLTPNHLYYFRVYAVNAGGTSTCSNTPGATDFPAPTGLTAAPESDSQALIGWASGIVGETGYTVQYSTDGSTWTTGATAAPGALNALVNGLSSNTFYYFRVQATATGSAGLWSASVFTRTFATITGAIAYDGFSVYPTGVTLNGGNAGTGWSNAWASSSPNDTTVVPNSLTGPTGFLTTGNQINITHQAVVSRNTSTSFGAVGGSNTWVSFLVTLPSDNDEAVLELANSSDTIKIGDLGAGNMTFQVDSDIWTAGSINATAGGTYFVVAEITNTSASETYTLWVNGAQSILDTTTHADFGTSNTVNLLTGSYYNTAAFDEIRIGTTYASVSPFAIPLVPTGLTATTISSSEIDLGWTNPTGTTQTGLHVQRSTDNVNFTTIATISSATQSTYSDTTVTAGTPYWYRITGFNTSGDSLYSNTANATAVSNVPTSLFATTISTSQINLTWSEPGSASSYKIYRAPDVAGVPGTFTLDGTSTTTNFSDTTGFSAGTRYWYEVTAVSSGVESADSSQVNATTFTAAVTGGGYAIAADNFGYTPGANLNLQGAAGNGWGGAWAGNNNPKISSTTLTGTNVNVVTSGASVTTTTGGYGGTRFLSSNLNTTGNTVWSSVLITPDVADEGLVDSAGFIIGNTEVDYISVGGTYRWELNSVDATWYGSKYNTVNTPALSSTPGTTNLIVIEQIFNGGVDSVYAWIDPSTATIPSQSSAFDYRTSINAGGTSTTVRLKSTYNSNTAFDEVRLGTSFAAVAPPGTPAAPSALSATAVSPSQINLAWHDNANNETGFKVYQSTNDTTFSLIATIATPNTQAYNVTTGLSGATQYWYEVTAYNSTESSDSNIATAMTAIAGGIASDSFSYSAGNLDNDGPAGNGWATGGWATNNKPTVSTTSLVPSSVSLATSGGSVTTTTGGYGGTRFLSSNLNTTGLPVWSSVLITPDIADESHVDSAGFIIGNTEVDYAQESDGSYRWELNAADGTWYGSHYNAHTNLQISTTGTTAFIVIEQIFNSGTNTDNVYAWVNPPTTPFGTAPTSATAFDSKTGVNAGGTLATVKLKSTYYSNTAFDEIRIGTSYAFVAPPQIAGLAINSTHSSSYSIQNRALATGLSQYGDVTKNFTTIATKYQGLTYIQTAEADSTSTTSNLISFTVYQPTIVYVVFDDAITAKPAWLTSQFTDTGDNIVTAQGTFSVYSMTVAPGLVILGGPGGTSGQGMYSVLLQSAL